MRSPIIVALVGALIGAGSRRLPEIENTHRSSGTPTPTGLIPTRMASGNKARLLERYLRRQRRIGGPDHG